ncbi:MAG: CBU_0592 family membrane protein [Nocardioidaceae bacterium]
MTAVLALEFVGALGILVPFALFQLNRTSQHSRLYLWLNLFGSGLLTVVGWLHHQWGFVILQGVWTLVTAWSIAKLLHRREATSSPE